LLCIGHVGEPLATNAAKKMTGTPAANQFNDFRIADEHPSSLQATPVFCPGTGSCRRV